MSDKKLCFLITILVVLFAAVASAAVPPMYFVDYKLLIALHPKMGNYDMVLERHLRSDINFADMERLNTLNLQIASLSTAAHQRVEKLMQDLDRVELELAKIDEHMTGQITEFDSNRQQFKGDNTRRGQTAKAAQLQTQRQEIDSQIAKVWDEVMNPLYLSRAQSQQIVESVLGEIDLMLEGMSRQLGGAVIVDSDFQAMQPLPEKITAAPAVGADPLSIRLYQSLLSSNLVGDVPDIYKRNPELAQYASAMRRDIEQGFDRNIAMQISKSPLFGHAVGLRGRLVLAGGQNHDLTRQVLENVFRKYGVRADIAGRILALIK